MPPGSLLKTHTGPAGREVAETWAPLHSPSAAKNTSLVLKLGYAHCGYLMVRTSPTSDGGCRHTRGRRTAAEDEMMTDDPTRCTNKSSQRQKSAEAIAVARPLGI
jgi:hypothetical protein